MFNYLYETLQTETLTKVRQWVKLQLVDMLLTANNDNFSETNFTKVNSPINRISMICFSFIDDFIQNLLPSFIFLIVVFAYFTYTNLKLGLAFLLGNVLLAAYIIFSWSDIRHYNELHEAQANENESHVLEVLNNVDKIVSRGLVKDELKALNSKAHVGIEDAKKFYGALDKHTIIMNIIIYAIILLSIGYLIFIFFKKEINFKAFVTIFSIIVLYRDKITSLISEIPGIIDFFGRADSITKDFKDVAEEHNIMVNKTFSPASLSFNAVEFENVTFKYKKSETYVYHNTNISVEMNNKIIGIIGASGRGKSTFAKLLIKLYKPESGKIYIDGQDIENIESEYLRNNITYINQSSKLFDKKIIENMLYGCPNDGGCEERVKQILKYDKIRELFANMDIYETKAGALGEGVSGGQRQVVNIISGLIHPSPILVLDEPTNALDGELKRELLEVIKEFKQHKKCIFIITHDKEVESILTEVLPL
jgi:ATP-binding cassette subfamily B protein